MEHTPKCHHHLTRRIAKQFTDTREVTAVYISQKSLLQLHYFLKMYHLSTGCLNGFISFFHMKKREKDKFTDIILQTR